MSTEFSPQLYVNNNSAVHLAVKQTAGTIYAVAIDTAATQYTVQPFARLDFLKTMTQVETNAASAATKILNSKLIPCSNAAITELKEIIMNASTVIAVTQTAEFLGRFIDEQTAAAIVPANSLVITSAASMLDSFTKQELYDALTVKPEQRLKDIKAADLANLLFDEYTKKEIKIMETEKKVKSKAAKPDKAPRTAGVKQQIRQLLNNGTVATAVKFVELTGATTLANVVTALTDLKSEKYCGEGGPIAVVSGVANGERVYSLAQFAPTYDAKPEKKEKAAKAAATA